ncbi:hypothetical protein LY76DRAFT_485692, partial [Colletotrichum caudatum]
PLDVVVTLRELAVIPVYLGNPRQREGPRHGSKQCADMILSLPADCRKLDDFDIDDAPGLKSTLPITATLSTLDPTADNIVSEASLANSFHRLSTTDIVARF